MRLIYTLTLYDVTNTVHLLDLGTGRRSGHGGVARRPAAWRLDSSVNIFSGFGIACIIVDDDDGFDTIGFFPDDA